jgi:hypothetical protein
MDWVRGINREEKGYLGLRVYLLLEGIKWV